MFWFFGLEACGILAAQPGIEPTLPALKGEVLTTGPPREVPQMPFLTDKIRTQIKSISCKLLVYLLSLFKPVGFYYISFFCPNLFVEDTGPFVI